MPTYAGPQNFVWRLSRRCGPLRRTLGPHVPLIRAIMSAGTSEPHVAAACSDPEPTAEAPPSRRRGRKRLNPHSISTLDPAKLTSADHLTVSNPWSRPRLFVYSRFTGGKVDIDLPNCTSRPQWANSTSTDKLGGFLYYHQYPNAPPLSSEIRFRLTTSHDPRSFPSGSDYMSLRSESVPWSFSLATIAASSSYAAFVHLLTSVDNLVPHGVMDCALSQNTLRFTFVSKTRATQSLYAFGQPFDLSLDHYSHTFVLTGKERLARFRVFGATYCQTSRKPEPIQRKLVPLSGSCAVHRRHTRVLLIATSAGTVRCCFEPSTLPEHAGKRVVVIRVLRILDPVHPNPAFPGTTCPPELIPRERELLQVVRYREVKPWSVDVDRKIAGGDILAAPLRILFENAIEYGSMWHTGQSN